MKRNVGKVDSIIRIILMALFIYLGITIHFVFYILAGLMLVTAATGMCGIYKLFGISTCKLNK